MPIYQFHRRIIRFLWLCSSRMKYIDFKTVISWQWRKRELLILLEHRYIEEGMCPTDSTFASPALCFKPVSSTFDPCNFIGSSNRTRRRLTHSRLVPLARNSVDPNVLLPTITISVRVRAKRSGAIIWNRPSSASPSMEKTLRTIEVLSTFLKNGISNSSIQF